MIEVRDVTKRFGTTVALDAVSFRLGEGEILGFLGPNGAGKSTAMKIITTFLAPDEGTVTVAGIDVQEQPLAVRGRIGYLPENVPLYVDMNVQEYLEFVGRARGLQGPRLKERFDWCVDACALGSELKKPIMELSKGFRQRTGLAQALIHDPDILILDEPTSGLDPLQILGIRDLIRSLATKKSIIFSTHILQEVPPVTDRVVIINEGRIVADGRIGDLARQTLGGDPQFERDVDAAATTLARGRAGELVELHKSRIALEDLFIALTKRSAAGKGRRVMSNVVTIFRREFAAYFNSPIAYIFIIVFLALNCGLFMTPFFLAGQADMRDFFGNLPLFLIFFIPAMTMRLWAEDKRSGTFELLMTLPMRSSEVMLGKYFAATAFYLVALAGTLPVPIMVNVLGNPDGGAIAAGYFGAVLLGALYMAVGIFTSGLMRDQISAFILGMVGCFVLFLLGMPAIASTIDGWFGGFGSFLQNALGLMPHFASLTRGVIEPADLAYFLGLTTVFLVLNNLWLEGRKY